MFVFRIRLPGWFVLCWLVITAFLMLGEIPAMNYLLIYPCLLLHLGLYWWGFSHVEKKGAAWVVLCLQIGLLLLISQMVNDAGAFLGLFFALLVATIELMQRVRALFLAISACLLCAALYIGTFGSWIAWSIASHEVHNTILVLLPLSVLVVALLILQRLQQERWAHRHTQVLLSERDRAHAQLKEAHARLSAYALRIEELTMLTDMLFKVRCIRFKAMNGMIIGQK